MQQEMQRNEYTTMQCKMELKAQKALQEQSYTILDTSEGTVFLHVNHGGYDSAWGNVYISDAVGTNFSLSLLLITTVR